MAEGTRFKALEEQIKRQENKLQEFIEDSLLNRKQIDERLETITAELKTLVATVSTQYGNLMRTINGDKGILGPGSNAEKFPNRSGNRNVIWLDEPHQERGVRKNFHGPFPKVEFPLFRGENPREWLRKCIKYFQIYHVAEEQWFDMIEMHLEDKADIWFQGFKMGLSKLSWPEFEEGLIKRFGEVGQDDAVEEFSKLQQTSTVLAYQEKFEELKARVLIKTPGLTEPFFISCFLSGLSEELKISVKMHKPRTLSDAFETARMQEKAFEAFTKKQKMASKSFALPSPRVNHALEGAESSKRGGSPVFQKISPSELQYRKTNHLCFKCGDRYGPGHVCSRKGIHMLLVDDEDKGKLEESILTEGEVIEYSGASSHKDVEFSIHSMTGELLQGTIKLKGKFNRKPLSIFLDGGSSHTFVKASVFEENPQLVVPRKPFAVKVANGQVLQCNSWVPRMTWEMQGHTFTHDVYVLAIESYNMVLGVDWMREHSPVTFDFKHLQFSFNQEGQEVKLQGDLGETNIKLRKGETVQKFLRRKKKETLRRPCVLAVDTPEVTSHTDDSISALLADYTDVFGEPSTLPPIRQLDHKIPLKPDSKPFKLIPYRYPHTQKNEIEKQVQEMLVNGIIQPSHSPFTSPVLLVRKKDETWRFCIDYRQLNEITIKDKFSIPIIDDLLDELHDIINFMPYAKLSKCTFGQPHVEYLGHIVTEDGVVTDPAKVESMVSWPRPDSVKALRGFLGLTGYYRRFVKGYGLIAKPLTDLLRKDSFEWSIEAENAFCQLKRAMSSTPVLAVPDFTKPFILETDASQKALGAVLMQQGRPIAYMSQVLANKNPRMSIYEKELLSLIVAVTKWRHYLMGAHSSLRRTMKVSSIC
ncbi:uncharacterized protein [Coffea arabica]|uniref:Mitochondrial protein n=1 Tax=Coffea arabica TaxID=13443 RepID=A0A6P6S3I4_COFAR|nr:uncharacterized protein LOC113687322 [Coffea arabica]